VGDCYWRGRGGGKLLEGMGWGVVTAGVGEVTGGGGVG
jgi:hypothetical protein